MFTNPLRTLPQYSENFINLLKVDSDLQCQILIPSILFVAGTFWNYLLNWIETGDLSLIDDTD